MLTPIAPDVWHLQGEPKKFPGGLWLPIASTVVRLPDRTLLLYSPVALDDAAVAALAAEGEVAHIVAPSLIHHLWALAAAERYPRATLHATPGLAAKVPAFATARELTDASTAIDATLDSVLVAGAPKLNETVMLHRPSGVLMCADLLFNVTTHPNVMTKVILSMTGTGGKQLAQSRMWKLGVKDRAAARASIDRVLAWPVRWVAPGHGEPVAVDAATLAAKMTRIYGGAVSAPGAARAA